MLMIMSTGMGTTMAMIMIITTIITPITSRSESAPDPAAAPGAGQKSFPGVIFVHRKRRPSAMITRVWVPSPFFRILLQISPLTIMQ